MTTDPEFCLSNASTSLLCLVIVAGVSGAGRSSALHRFEDLGFLTLENIPATMLTEFFAHLKSDLSEHKQVALTVKNDNEQDIATLLSILDSLDSSLLGTYTVFLDSSTETIVKRYRETRRPHPKFDPAIDASLSDTVSRERQRLEPLKFRSHLVLDTTSLSIHDLRREILAFCQTLKAEVSAKMRVNIQSFGFKYGTPRDADMLIDVRFLDNPYFEPELRELSGLDKAVSEYVLNLPATQIFLDKYIDLLSFLIPKYQHEGKAYLNVGIGCTGGQHRSVALAEAITSRLSAFDIHLSVRHRDARPRPSLSQLQES
jgi:RNase adapter protein RapZ